MRSQNFPVLLAPLLPIVMYFMQKSIEFWHGGLFQLRKGALGPRAAAVTTAKKPTLVGGTRLARF
jgi:hypothetical protein